MSLKRTLLLLASVIPVPRCYLNAWTPPGVKGMQQVGGKNTTNMVWFSSHFSEVWLENAKGFCELLLLADRSECAGGESVGLIGFDSSTMVSLWKFLARVGMWDMLAERGGGGG